MAKTKEISTLETISANSAYILGKSKEGKIGFINNVFNEQGKLAEVPDHTKFATKTDLDQYVKIQIKDGKNVAYMNNESNGGLIKFTKADGTMSKFTLFDASDADKTMLQIIVKDGKTDKVAKINGNVDGLYYIKTATNTPVADNELATLGDVAKKTTKEMQGTQTGDVAKIQNQTDGGVMQYVKSDGSNAAILVSDGQTDGIGTEICTLDGSGNGTRIVTTTSGAYYSVGSSVTVDDAAKLVTQGDLVQFSPAQITGVSEGDVATCHNSADGGSLKYESATHTAFIGVNCDANSKEMLAEFALTEKKDGTNLKSGNRLLAKKEGIFYTKGTDLTTAEDNEIATIADVKKKLDAESKGHIGSGKFSFVAGVAGASVKYVDETRKKSSTVGVCDGNTDGILAQMVAGPMEMGKGPKIFLDENIAVYCKGKLLVDEEDEILTKKDIKQLEQEVKEITTVNDLVEAAQDDITELETKINELTKKIEALESRANTLEADSKSLQTSMTDAVEKVNTYTANVSELLKQST